MKRSRTIRTVLVAGVAAAALGLSACSGSADSGEVTLEFLQSGDANQGGGYAAMAAEYEKETGVKVDVVEVPSADLQTRLRTASQANDVPALAAAPGVDPAWSDRLLDLSDISDEAGVIDTLEVPDPTDGDKVKALPTTLTSVGMFLNKSLWDEAGVSYPTSTDEQWTWDEFVDSATQVVEATDAQYGAVMDRSAHRLRAFLYEFGSQGVTEQDDGSWALDREGADAFEYFKNLNDDGFIPASVWASAEDASATFKSGRVAAYLSGVWQIADFQENISDFEWVSVPLPQEPVRATNYGAASWIVAFDGSGVEQEALDFISWMYQPEHYAEYCEISACLPALDGIDVDYGDDSYAFDLYNDEIAESPEVSAAQTTDALLNGYLGVSVDSEPLEDEMVRYLTGEATLDEAVAAVGEATTEQMAAAGE
ncbi:extracellular solute-binding protein [Microbacterium indicum]|uniref:extracellular solute-binding protein n=1 Tax=Microbacterium indicum TaxID=358100 RepID=UPI00041AC3D0|nr:extracellular solute-binding protein [Microbacterium indicum]